MHGVLVVDKPRGPTSHDVVAWARRALGTRAVGHAGTLDPMATGVLVLGVGEGTKLTSFLMGEDKEYETTLALGAETDTLDAEGQVTEELEVPAIDRGMIERAIAPFVGTYLQRAPSVSAIKKDGVRLHERVRRGEDVVAPEREVTCFAIEVRDVHPDAIDLTVKCAKGFYVRSFGRDLARALGTRGHLSALRRTRSGRFAADEGVPGEVLLRAREDESARVLVRAGVRPIERSLGEMPRLQVDAAGEREIRCGRPLVVERPSSAHVAVMGPSGALLAIAHWDRDALRVMRGFNVAVTSETVTSETEQGA